MKEDTACKGIDIPRPADISDEDVYAAMKEIPGYLDITPGDFKEIFHLAYRHAVDRFASSVKAKDVMTKNVVFVTGKTSLKEAADTMAHNGISGIPVVEDNTKVMGVLSEKDFLSHMGAQDAITFMGVVAECLKGSGCVAVPIREQKAEDIMTSPAITVDQDTTLMEVANTLKEKKINRVPVTDKDDNLSGIISRADILQSYLIGDKE
jgi:CBS domain-containing membrane protein